MKQAENTFPTVSRKSTSILLFSLLLASCAAKKTAVGPAVYQLKKTNLQEAVLFPPRVPDVQSKAVLELNLGKARMARKTKQSCDVLTDTMQLHWKKNQAHLTVKTEDMRQTERIAMSLIKDIDTFRIKMVALEANGCLKGGEASPLLMRMVEGLALPPRVAYLLRYGTNVTDGYIDVQDPFRMKVVVPLLKPGLTEKKEPSDVLGFETAWYAVRPGLRNTGYRLMAEMVETNMRGQVTMSATPTKAKVELADKFQFFRIFFLTRRSVMDHDILLLGARDKESLEKDTALIKKDGEESCRTLSDEKAACLQVPRDSAVSAELRVKAKDRYVYVPINGTLNDVLRAAKVARPADVLPTLKITRPFEKTLVAVQFDATKPDILTLVLIGGEEISW